MARPLLPPPLSLTGLAISGGTFFAASFSPIFFSPIKKSAYGQDLRRLDILYRFPPSKTGPYYSETDFFLFLFYIKLLKMKDCCRDLISGL